MKLKSEIRPADPLRANEDAFFLDSATLNGNPIPIWDEGWGKLYAIWDNCGHWSYPIGVVRERSWEEAYSAATDEIFPGPTDEEIEEEITEEMQETGELPGGWDYRGSGTPSNESKFPNVRSPYAVYSMDINNPVTLLTREIMEAHELEVVFKLYSADSYVRIYSTSRCQNCKQPQGCSL
jgi:hypothetical protein